MTLYGTLLDVASGMLSGSSALQPSHDVTSRMLEHMARNSAIAGVIIVLDRNGFSLGDSARKRKLTDNFRDRPYFTVHRDRAGVGLFQPTLRKQAEEGRSKPWRNEKDGM